MAHSSTDEYVITCVLTFSCIYTCFRPGAFLKRRYIQKCLVGNTICYNTVPNVHHNLYLPNLLHPKTVQNVLVHREMGSSAKLVFEHFRPKFASLDFHGLYLTNNYSCQDSSTPYNEVCQDPLPSPSSG